MPGGTSADRSGADRPAQTARPFRTATPPGGVTTTPIPGIRLSIEFRPVPVEATAAEMKTFLLPTRMIPFCGPRRPLRLPFKHHPHRRSPIARQQVVRGGGLLRAEAVGDQVGDAH